MEYIRVKITDGDLANSQIMSKSQFDGWLITHGPDLWSKCRDGLKVTFSKVKKSPLLSKNPKS